MTKFGAAFIHLSNRLKTQKDHRVNLKNIQKKNKAKFVFETIHLQEFGFMTSVDLFDGHKLQSRFFHTETFSDLQEIWTNSF